MRRMPVRYQGNHPKEWIYLDHGFAQRFKSNTALYGTVFNGKQKFFKNREWENRKVTVS